MITLTELATLSESQPTHRLLKPWWDVLMDYFVVIMLMVSLLSATLLISNDKVACLPCNNVHSLNTSSRCNPPKPPSLPRKLESSTERAHVDQSSPSSSGRAGESLGDNQVKPSSPTQERRVGGHKTNLDYQQYVYISQVCYQKALPWYSKYFPYVALVHSIILMVSGNFWFKFPKTSSKVEHFVSILGKCFESPWTTKAVSETANEDSENSQHRTKMFKSVTLEPNENSDTCSSLTSCPEVTFEPPVTGSPSMNILDKQDGEQAKALFEKVRRFRAHTEDGDLIYKFYVGQAIVKALKFMIILSYTFTFVNSITFEHICKPKIKNVTGYAVFLCTHSMAHMLQKLLITYIVLIVLYGLVCLYTLYWLFRGSLKEYSFEKVREESNFSDIPDVKNDFAFLLHMVDQYDQLYSKRFAIFLSEGCENKLLEMNLNHEWTYEKLRQHVSKNSQGKLELQLFMLSGIPKAVFDMSDLEVLKLELVPDVKLPAKMSQMAALKELYLYHCPAKVDQIAFNFLRDHLHILHVKFTDIGEIPLWVYSLKNLVELHLSGNLNSETNKAIGLESLKELRHLKILILKSNLSKIPSNVMELATHLSRLVIQNDGTKLLVLNNLKKLAMLSELELQNCELERIPHAIFSLANLQKIDLKSNNIQTIEEIVSFQHLKRLSCLKLWHNSILSIPTTISLIKNLEQLFLNNNKLESLPSALFTLRKLRHLDLSHNLLTIVPPDFQLLQNLQHFSITKNKVEILSIQLFQCLKLKTLHLGQNCITCIPPEIGQLTQLTYLELKGNHLERLPAEIGHCLLLKKTNLIVEDILFDRLPPDVKDNLAEQDFISVV
ncbi:volume-regulated anion channel subunit LRRC8D-like [Leucoraja erinacea]|uniref:volume-regulated anion channel subunit LRRC8D-like n=1 Tax=Leucoraja erinaceus TaxID=7782 RepID=UPI002455368F|nr:volume-regulated anion channel subunit LRRC8D-like [Leucoraja erinacea]